MNHRDITFEDLYNEQIEAAARMFLLIAESFTEQVDLPDLVAMCQIGHGDGSYNCLDEEVTLESIFLSAIERFEYEFTLIIRPFVLKRVEEELTK